MPDDPEVKAKFTADVSDLESKAKKGTAAISGMVTMSAAEFAKMERTIKRQSDQINELTTRIVTFGHAGNRWIGNGVASDLVRAESQFLLFDRTFRLGIDREMLTILNAFPALQRFLTMLGSNNWSLGFMLAVTFAVEGIKKLEEAWQSYKDVVHSVQDINDEWRGGINESRNSADSLSVELDKLIIQHEKLTTGRASAGMLDKLQFDETAEAADKLADMLDKDIDKFKELADSSKGAVGFWQQMAFGVESTKGVKDALDKLTESSKKETEAARTELDLARLSGNQRKIDKATLDLLISGNHALIQEQLGIKTQMDEVNAEMRRQADLQKALSRATATTGVTMLDQSSKLAILKDAYNLLTKQIDELNRAYAVLVEKEKTAGDPEKEAALKKASQLRLAEAAAAKAAAEDEVKISDDAAKRELEAHRISQDEYTRIVEAGAQARADAERKYLDVQIAEARKMPGKESELPGLLEKRKALAGDTANEMANIRQTAETKDADLQREMALAQITADEKLADSREKSANAHYAAMLQLHQVTDQENLAQQLDSADTELTNFKTNAKARIELLKGLGKDGEAQIQQINNDVIQMEQDTENKKLSLMDQNREREQARREALFNAQRSIATTNANQALSDANAVNDRIFAAGNEPISIWAGNATAALNKWHHDAIAEADAELQHLIDNNQQDTAAYAQAQQKKAEIERKFYLDSQSIHQKQLEQWKNLQQQFTNSFNSTVDKWLTGQGRMSANWRNMADEMGLAFSNMLLHNLEQLLMYEIRTRVLHMATKAEIAAADATGAAMSTALSAKSALQQTNHWAVVAAAKTQAAFSSIPIVGPAIGAAAAVAVYASLMAMAAFKKGGILGGYGAGYGYEVPFLGTPGERVLSVEQTHNFDDMVNSHTKGQSDSNVHFHYSPNVSGIDGASVEKMARNHGRTWERQTYHMLRLKGLVQ